MDLARGAALVDHCLSLCCLMLNIGENFFSCIAFGVFHCFSWVPPPDTCLSMCCVVVNINWHYLFHIGFTVSAGRGGPWTPARISHG